MKSYKNFKNNNKTKNNKTYIYKKKALKTK